jgi:hypothetical protein
MAGGHLASERMAGSALSCAAGYTGIESVNVRLADQDSFGCGRAEVLDQGTVVMTLGTTKILGLFAGNMAAGTSLQAVVHVTGKGLGNVRGRSSDVRCMGTEQTL